MVSVSRMAAVNNSSNQ